MRVIDYFFICSSPFAYLGHHALHEIAGRHGATIRYRPVDIMGVWESSGSVPLGKRTPTRQRYRRIELQRIAHMRGLAINLEPRHFPVDPNLADRCAIALVERGASPEGFVWKAHQGVWVNEEDIADATQLAAYLEADGHDADAVLAHAREEATADALARNTLDARDADAVGVPVYVLDGEPFWGQDRLEHLDHMLATGRPAFRP